MGKYPGWRPARFEGIMLVKNKEDYIIHVKLLKTMHLQGMDEQYEELFGECCETYFPEVSPDMLRRDIEAEGIQRYPSDRFRWKFLRDSEAAGKSEVRAPNIARMFGYKGDIVPVAEALPLMKGIMDRYGWEY